MFHRHFGSRGLRRWFDEQEQGEQGEHHDPRREHIEALRQWRRMQAGHHFGGRGGRGGRGGPFGGFPFGGDSFGGDFDHEGGGRQRQRRGDIKYALLELIAEQPRHGYDLIKALEARYGGFYRPSPGSVYPTLQLLEDEGNLTSEVVEGKRIYTITEAGSRLLSEHQQRRGGEGIGPHRFGPFGRNHEQLNELRHRAMGLFSAVMQAARHASPAQLKEIQELLDASTRQVYTILAREDHERSE